MLRRAVPYPTDHLPPCSATDTLHCLGTVLDAMNLSLPTPVYTEAFPQMAKNETMIKMAEMCVAECNYINESLVCSGIDLKTR